MTKVHLAEMTGAEARAALAEAPVVLVPAGSHEDHGPQTPMGDYLVAERLAVEVASAATARGQRTLVAPVLPFGGANFFGPCPGGIGLGQETIRMVLRDMLGGLLRNGLTRIVVLNGHNGNVAPVHDVCLEIYRDSGVLIPSLFLWPACGKALVKAKGPDFAKRARGHGADPVTSVNWHLFPERMRPDLIRAAAPVPDVMGLPVTGFGQLSMGALDISVPLEADACAPEGVLGCDPRLSSPETGAAIVATVVAEFTDFVLHFAAHTPAAHAPLAETAR